MPGRLTGRVALLTGAVGGIGSATALALACEGALLVLTDRKVEETRELCQTLPDGTTWIAHGGDISDGTYVESLVSEAVAEFGRVDVLINNAGSHGGASLASSDEALWERLMATNAKSQFLLCREVVPLMRAAGGGAIVNVSSVNGIIGRPNACVYSASKAAVLGLTRALANELAIDNIRVNALCPGAIDTAMPRSFLSAFPEDQHEELKRGFFARQLMKRFGRPEEVAEVIVFLASDSASFMTGAVMPVDGGWTSW